MTAPNANDPQLTEKQLSNADQEIVKTLGLANINTYGDLGAELDKRFHNKQNPNELKELVESGVVSVNYRLSYGLEIKLESDFVGEFNLLLEGDKGEDSLIENAKKLIPEDHVMGLVNYIKTGPEIFNILHHSKSANQQTIPVNPAFTDYLKQNATDARFEPANENGSLIIAAGIRDVELVADIIAIGEKSSTEKEKNGAFINFKGFFNDNAAIWSAILLDKPTLELLLNKGSDMENIGLTGSSLLHWVVVAARLDDTPSRKQKSEEIVKMLIDRRLDPNAKNKLGKTAMDYADSSMKKLMKECIASKERDTSQTSSIFKPKPSDSSEEAIKPHNTVPPKRT